LSESDVKENTSYLRRQLALEPLKVFVVMNGLIVYW